MRTPSPFQQAIFDWIKTGTGDAVVEAVAGSGKTTTAVASMNLIPESESVLFLAFNKSIAEELAERAPKHADVRTLNSLGLRTWMKFAGSVQVNGNKTRDIMDANISPFELRKYGQAVRRLVGVAKSQGLVPSTVRRARGLIPDTVENWEGLIDHFDIDLGENSTSEDEQHAIELARQVLTISCGQIHGVDFDDQLYMPVIFGVAPNKYQWVFVDEAQDLSPIQHRLVEMARKTGGRIVAIGDSRQAIYGFRGADSNSMKNFQKRLNATTLPLSICYRCPQSHIKLAKTLVPQIEAAPTAPEGEIMHLGSQWSATIFRNDDLVICRNGAPLVRAAYSILAQKVPVRILGRDLGTGLVNLIKKLKPQNTDDLITRLVKWSTKEIERLRAKDPDGSTDRIDDKVETIMTFIDMFPNAGPQGICQEIERLYSDNTGDILTLSTIHKAKGLEAHRVFILNPELMPSKGARLPWQKDQEANLQYVAYTRAKHTLAFITIEKKKGGAKR